MNLGGYKFAGYKCKKDSGSSMSDDELALLLHKTRVKAFLEACNKAHADWHFYRNDGVYDFEGNHGVIHGVINIPHDLVSYFQYGNQDKYFAIISCPAITDNVFHNKSRGYGMYDTNSSKYIWTYRTFFHSVSMEPFPDDFMISTVTSDYPNKTLPLLPISTTYITSSNNVVSMTDGGHWFRYAYDNFYVYFGYAVKGSKIITFSCQGYDAFLSQGKIFVSVLGFNAMRLSSSSDSYNLFEASLNQSNTNSNECVFNIKQNDYRMNSCVQTLTSSGTLYAESGKMSIMYISTSGMAGQLYGVSNMLALSACYITTSENGNPTSDIRQVTPYLTEEGFFSKGMIDIDFLACANTNSSSSLNSCGSYAGGKYLLACKDYGQNLQYFVGWDSSNPNITQDSSWIRYEG